MEKYKFFREADGKYALKKRREPILYLGVLSIVFGIFSCGISCYSGKVVAGIVLGVFFVGMGAVGLAMLFRTNFRIAFDPRLRVVTHGGRVAYPFNSLRRLEVHSIKIRYLYMVFEVDGEEVILQIAKFRRRLVSEVASIMRITLQEGQDKKGAVVWRVD